jgi:hypothetical protein
MRKNHFILGFIIVNTIGVLISKYISFEASGVYVAVVFGLFLIFWVASIFQKD